MNSPHHVQLSPVEVKADPPPEGFRNAELDFNRTQIIRGASYRDCSTVAIYPTPGTGLLHHKVADSMKYLLVPMNQKLIPFRMVDMEVADAYNAAISMILNNPDLAKCRFILTWEHDNVAPPDGLIKLVETMYSGPWAGVGGLYWIKGESGAPMIFGDPLDPIPNFRPQPPVIEGVQECRGIAMGFSLFDMDLFKDERMKVDTPMGKGWFRTLNSYSPSSGTASGTQDLDFCARAGQLGYRFAVDTRVRVGHVQLEATPTHPAGFVW